MSDDHDDAIRAAIAAYHKRDVRPDEWVYGEARAIFAAGMRWAADQFPDDYRYYLDVASHLRAAADKLEQEQP